MSSIIKEVRVRGSVVQDRDIKVTIEKTGLLGKKRKVYSTFWGSNQKAFSFEEEDDSIMNSDNPLYNWVPIEFAVKDLTVDNNFGEYQKYYEEYIKERDRPKTGFKIYSRFQRNNLEFSPEWNTDLDIIKLFILINTEKYKKKVNEWSLIQDPIKGEKGGLAPYYREFGFDSYYLNNGTSIRIAWSEGNYSAGGRTWSDEDGKELSSQDMNRWDTSWREHKKKPLFKKRVDSIWSPEGNPAGDRRLVFNPDGPAPNFAKDGPDANFSWQDKDLDILNIIVSSWKQAVPGYDALAIVKNSHGTPAIYLSESSDKIIEYKSPFGASASGPTASGPITGASASGASASGPTASGASASVASTAPTASVFMPTLKGIADGFQISEKTDLPNFSIYVGDPEKDWPKVAENPEVPEDGEDFDNLEGASVLDEDTMDEEYTEESFAGPEEKDLVFNNSILDPPGTEPQSTNSYLDKGGAGTEQVGPISSGLPANELQKESAKRAIVAAGCMKTGGGACGRYTWNLAKNYHRFLKGLSGLDKQEPAGGNANQVSYYGRLEKELKYKNIVKKSSISKSDLISAINDTKWGIGDVICYWSNDTNISNNEPGYRRYGHTQMYVGAASVSGWVCDRVDNYGSKFVYGKAKDNDWGFVAYRSPNVPSNA